jgi:glyoxylase-like metal-dependent hydrolase (beta-lactamase superfamily II)
MTAPVRISAGLWRLRADNPSPLTGTGTNTYLVGTDEIAVIDPGPDLAGHLAAILQAAGGRRVAAIIVTHAHRDHSALAPRLAAATGAELLAFGGAHDGISPKMAALGEGLGGSGEGLDHAFTPDRRLADGDVVTGPDWTLRAIHTPGHLGGHICLATGRTLISGDHVMGWSTSIVSPPEGDMGDYMASLDRLGQEAWDLALPGHGEPVTDPMARMAELAAHRRMREAQVLDQLAVGTGTAAGLAKRIYTDLAPGLLPAATRNVLAHLIDLSSRNRVTADPAIGLDSLWQLN